MKILHISFSDNQGGAAIAALRICKAQRKAGMDARMLVASKRTQHPFVQADTSRWKKTETFLKDKIVQKLLRFERTSNPILHSLNLFPSFLHLAINKSDADLVNLHWVGKEMISIEEIAKIRKPIVWTLHDSWAFCGTEHHPDGLEDERFVNGYTTHPAGINFNRWTWRRKMAAWRKTRFTIVAPSHWEAGLARKSELMKFMDVHVIPNPLNTSTFSPWSKLEARRLLDLPETRKIILFGALDSDKDKNKGYAVLQESLKILAKCYPAQKPLAVLFGSAAPKNMMDVGLPEIYMGKIKDEMTMARLYAAADVMVVPSRMENLPQTATEPLACGTPVVAFRVGGLPDVIEHRHNGYLAEPYSPKDLAEGIRWALEHPDPAGLSALARDRAVGQYDEGKIAARYNELYCQMLNANNTPDNPPTDESQPVNFRTLEFP